MTSGRHGGDLRAAAARAGCRPDELVDFSASINPVGPPEWLRCTVSRALSQVVHYPDPELRDLIDAAARRFGVPPEQVLPGAGVSMLIGLLPRVWSARRALIVAPAYVDYARAARDAGLEVVHHMRSEERGFALEPWRLGDAIEPGDMVWLGRPNNPDGSAVGRDALRELIVAHPEASFVVDEAFIDFTPHASLGAVRPPNAVVLRSLTKFYAIPGFRVGLALAEPPLVQRAREAVASWPIGSVAAAVGTACLEEGSDRAAATRALVDEQRAVLARALGELPGCTVYPGEANFLLVRIDHPRLDGADVARRLLEARLVIRCCDDFHGLDRRFVRIAVRGADDNARLVEALRSRLDSGALRGDASSRPGVRRRSRTPALMVQGTASDVGKSLLSAALCRILLQDGLDVAPFKAQNMALNSGVTRDGKEMGRAQIVQAHACRLDADARMNPILLKPMGEQRSQVVLLGEPQRPMEVDDYFAYRRRAAAVVRRAYDELAAEHEVMVIEGAGSPAEVNLKRHDIVNMGMAAHADARVVLVGDIDRGGVFAALVGTMELLSEAERARVAGLIINRFRGKRELLDDGLDYLRLHTGRPLLGVVPHIAEHGLPEEDSVAFKRSASHSAREGRRGRSADRDRPLTIGLIDLPYVSNFNDADPLRGEPDVLLEIVRRPEQLDTAAAVIVPGSRNVPHDLEFLRRSGLEEALRRLAGRGDVELVGICGGLQILGDRLLDPAAVESDRPEHRGLGLLQLSTRLDPSKVLRRTGGRHLPSGCAVRGYEIHHGRTRLGPGLATVIVDGSDAVLGVGDPGRPIWGTYLHGVFDADDFRRHFLDGLRARRGLAPLGAVQAPYALEPALDRLADVVRAHLDIARIHAILRGA